jgi:large repetitive protein
VRQIIGGNVDFREEKLHEAGTAKQGFAMSMKFCTRLIGHGLGISTCVFLLAPLWRADAQVTPGTIDSSFNASVNGQVHAVAIQPDGRIYIGGTFDWVGGFQPGLARLRTNGTRDASFSASVDGSVSTILLDAAGNIVIGGAFRSVTSPSSINSLPRANLARLFSDGRLDEMFYAMANTNVQTLVRGDADKILVGGHFSRIYDGLMLVPLARNRITRLTAAGIDDGAFAATNRGANGTIWAMARQPDGKVLVGGSFSSFDGLAAGRLVRLNDDSSLDPGFSVTTDSSVTGIVVQPDGRIIIIGEFSAVNGQPRRYLARLNAGGSLDPEFNANLSLAGGGVLGVALDSVGRIYAGGTFTEINGLHRPRVIRLHPDGQLDTGFNIGNTPSNMVLRVATDANDDVLVAGDFMVGGTHRSLLRARGGPSVPSAPGIVKPLTNTSVLFGRQLVFSVDATGGPTLAFHWEKDGVPIDEYRATHIVQSAQLEHGGTYRVVVSNALGIATTEAVVTIDTAPPVITRHPINEVGSAGQRIRFIGFASGAPSPSIQWQFNGTNIPGTNATLVLNNVTFAHAGDYRFIASNAVGVATSVVAQLVVVPAKTNVGAVDVGFIPAIGPTNAPVTAGAFQADGKFVLLGGVGPYPKVHRYFPDGSRDLSFNAAGTGNRDIQCVAIQPDGKVILGGRFLDLGGLPVINFARLHSDGTLDTNFNVAPGFGIVRRILVQPDGKILFAADEGSSSGIILGRVLPDGRADPHFRQQGSNGGAIPVTIDTRADDLLLQSDGKIVLAGTFGVLRFLANGALDLTFARNNQSPIRSPYRVALRNDGSVVVGGMTASTNQNTLELLHPDGSLDTNFAPRVTRNITALAVQPDGKILIGGSFDNVGGVARPRVARLHSNGSLDLAYDPGAYSPSPNQLISAILLDSDCAAMVLGNFFEFNRYDRIGLVRLLPDAPAPPQIVRQPASQTLFVGQTARFSIDHSCSPPPHLQWFHDDTLIDGATSPLLVIRNTHTTDAGAYTVVVSNNFGAITSAVATLTLNPAPTNSGAIDISFYTGSGPNDSVHAAVEQPDGKVVIGGLFSAVDGVPRNRIARLNADGSLDPTFDPGVGPGPVSFSAGPNPVVYALALQEEGKVVVGGLFGSMNGLLHHSLARLRSDGSVDTTFPTNHFQAARAVVAFAPQPDGKMLVGSADSQRLIIRLNPDGTRDTSINYQAPPVISMSSLAPLPDGRLLGGSSGTTSPLFRLRTNGLQDNFFPSVGANVTSIALLDDDYVIGGSFQGTARYVTRLTPSGSVAPGSWSSLNVNRPVESVIVDACERVWMGGSMTTVNGVARPGLARLHADGTPDTTFASFADGRVLRLVRGNGSRIFVLGDFFEINGVARRGIARLIEEPPGLPLFASSPANHSTVQGQDFMLDARISCAVNTTLQWQHNGVDVPGATNATLEFRNARAAEDGYYQVIASNQFGSVTSSVARVSLAPAPTMPGDNDIRFYPPPGEHESVVALKLQDASRILVINGSPGAVARLRRYFTNGAADLSFDGGGVLSPRYLAIAPNSDIYTATDSALHRLDPNGIRDTNFVVTLAGGTPREIIVQPDGKVVLVGSFTQVNGASHRRVVRLNPDGGFDPGFNAGEGADASINCVALQTDGKLLIGGSFSQVTGTNSHLRRLRVARLHPDGSLDTNFVSGFPNNSGFTDSRVDAIAVQNDGRILVSGYIIAYGGEFRGHLVRIHPNGMLDTTFNPSLTNSVYDLALQPDGKVIVAGVGPLLRLRSNGTIDTSFVSGGPPSAAAFFSGVRSLALTRTGEIYIGGNFTHYDGFARPSFARVHGDPPILGPLITASGLRMSMHTDPGRTYYFESTPVNPVGWAVLQTIPGSGGEETFTDPNPAGPRLYRIRVE